MKKLYEKCDCGRRFWGYNNDTRLKALAAHRKFCHVVVAWNRVCEERDSLKKKVEQYHKDIRALTMKTENLQKIITMRDETIIKLTKTNNVLKQDVASFKENIKYVVEKYYGAF